MGTQTATTTLGEILTTLDPNAYIAEYGDEHTTVVPVLMYLDPRMWGDSERLDAEAEWNEFNWTIKMSSEIGQRPARFEVLDEEEKERLDAEAEQRGAVTEQELGELWAEMNA